MSEMEDRKAELMAMQQESGVSKLTDVDLPKAWKISPAGLESIKLAVAMNSTKHGMYASIPMLCRADNCMYAPVCPLAEVGMAPEGERCPLEIAMILKKYEEYKDEFDINDSNIVDMGLVKDLIDYDIQLFRAENKIAIQGDFIEEVVVDVTKSGEVLTAPQLSKATEYKDKVMSKRFKVLELMNSTRKDKAGDKLQVQLDPSSYAASLMAQVSEGLRHGEIIEGDYREMNKQLDNLGGDDEKW